MAHAHASLIVHRDVKPSNVLVTNDGRVKLRDFGIAKLLEEDERGAPTVLTLDGAGPLTPANAAPEQVTGQPVSTATDVYGLGVLLYLLLTGTHPAGAATRSRQPLPGWIDRVSFAEPGLFQAGAAIIDTRTLTFAEMQWPFEAQPDTAVPPLDLSPDERSFVWLSYESAGGRRLGVTDWRANRSYLLPIDPVRMRYPAVSSLDPTWVRHHVEWVRGADGVETLVERAQFTPLPYRGDVTLGKRGAIQSYTLKPGGVALRDAIVDLMIRDLEGRENSGNAGSYVRGVRVNDAAYHVAVIGSPSYIYLTMDGPESDARMFSAIAAKLDAALATGRYDALFVSDP